MPAPGRVQNFRSSVQSEQKRSKSKGFKGGYRDRLDVPKVSPTWILLTPGDYEDLRDEEIRNNGGVPPKKHYHTRPEHGIKIGEMFRGGSCLAGYDHKGDCLCCHRKESGDVRVTTRDKYSVNVLHFSLFRKEVLKDKKTGSPLRFEQDGANHKRGDPIKGWTEVTSLRDQKDLRGRLQAGEEMEDVGCVRKKFLDVGRGHLGNIMQIAEQAEKLCWCGGNLTPYEFVCSGCDAVLCNVEDQDLTLDDVARYAQQQARCACGVFDRPLQNVMCNNGGCTEPRAMSIFDVMAFVRRAGEGTQSQVIIEKIMPIHEFVTEDGQGLLKPGEEFIEVEGVLTPNFRDDLSKMMPQFDFDKVHQVMSNEDAAALLKCDNPFRKGGRDYAANQNTDEGEPAPDAGERRPPPRRQPVRG